MCEANRKRRETAPRLELLEARELLTFSLVHHAKLAAPGTLATLAQRAALQAQAAGSAGIGDHATPPPTVDASGTPTPHEIRRESFVGRFKGNYTIGPGRTSAQSLQLSALGYGGSNQSFHLWTNMRITVPTDPSLPPTGVIYIISWNVGTTGTQLFLDLKALPGSTRVNGIPTQYTWTVDPSSSGIYANVAGYGTGTGTMNVQFFRPSPAKPPGTLQGQMNFAINGLIDVSGDFNVIGVLGNKPNGGGKP
jgi:hypothetical protein